MPSRRRRKIDEIPSERPNQIDLDPKASGRTSVFETQHGAGIVEIKAEVPEPISIVKRPKDRGGVKKMDRSDRC